MTALTRRYVVMTLATEAPFDPGDPDGVFVLKPWKDPAALQALRAYRDNCFPELKRDLDAWIRLVEAGPTVRGDIGRRNEAHLRTSRARPSRAAGKRTAARPPPTTRRVAKAKKKPAKKRRR
jgi:hypothetical protein